VKPSLNIPVAADSNMSAISVLYTIMQQPCGQLLIVLVLEMLQSDVNKGFNYVLYLIFVHIVKIKVEVKETLLATISLTVFFVAKPHLAPKTRFLLLSESC
jgi:hypothetical protein